jgi:hypothetical protein
MAKALLRPLQAEAEAPTWLFAQEIATPHEGKNGDF